MKGMRNGEPVEEERGDDQLQLQRIADAGSVITGGGRTVHCLTVIGQIEGHNVLPSQNKTTKYEHVIPQLVAIEEADGQSGAGRRPFHRRPACGSGEAQLHRAKCDYDDSSGANERPDARCSADDGLLPADAGTNHTLCHCQFAHFRFPVL